MVRFCVELRTVVMICLSRSLFFLFSQFMLIVLNGCRLAENCQFYDNVKVSLKFNQLVEVLLVSCHTVCHIKS